MKNVRKQLAGAAALALLVLPAGAFAQVYYYAPNTTSGAYNYGSYIPPYAMPYMNMNYGYQMQQQSQQQSQQQYQSHSYPSYTQQYSYPSNNYGYMMPSNNYSQTSNYYQAPNYYQQGLYTSAPQSYSYPSGSYGTFGTQLCYWSDYPTYAPCGRDPQQWIQDPYTGMWY